MLKVLMTGMTLQQVGLESRVRLRYCSNPSLLERAIMEAGHEVTRCPVIPGEDLGKFDCVIVGLANMLSFGSRFSLGAVWAAGHSNTAYLLDDWNVGATFKSIQACARGRVDEGLMRSVLPRDHKAEGKLVVEYLLGTLGEMTENRWTKPTLGSFFSWGDRNRFKAGTNIGEIWGFDPSCFQPVYCDRADRQHKDRQWILASLPNQTPWLKKLSLRWPVKVYGHLKSGAERLSEREVVGKYCESWGVLSPKYKHAGSGWWRARFRYAADARAVMFADFEEVQKLGSSYWFEKGCRHLEELSDRALEELADAQRAEFYEKMWDVDTLVQWADGMVRRLSAGAEPIENSVVQSGTSMVQ